MQILSKLPNYIQQSKYIRIRHQNKTKKKITKFIIHHRVWRRGGWHISIRLCVRARTHFNLPSHTQLILLLLTSHSCCDAKQCTMRTGTETRFLASTLRRNVTGWPASTVSCDLETPDCCPVSWWIATIYFDWTPELHN